jgi:hypothetical protein
MKKFKPPEGSRARTEGDLKKRGKEGQMSGAYNVHVSMIRPISR